MCRRDGVEQLIDERHDLSHRQTLRLAKLIDALAADKFHRDPGALLLDSRVNQPRDAGVLNPCQQLRFAAEKRLGVF